MSWIPLLRGRQPQPGERAVTIVNRALADRLWPDRDPIGKSLLGQVIAVVPTGRYWY